MTDIGDMTRGNNKGAAGPGVDNNSQISRRLRELYDSVQDESIPDRFLDLLEKLDEAEKASKPAVNNDRTK